MQPLRHPPHYSGMQPGSAAPAAPARPTTTGKTTSTRVGVPRRPAVTPTLQTPPGVTPIDWITVALGLLVFGGLAWILLVLA